MSVFDKHPLPWKAAGFIISDASDSHVATAAGNLAVAAIIVKAVNAMSQEISRLLLQYDGDDQSGKIRNGYGPFYDELLPSRRESTKAVLELGVFRGNSLRAWKAIFPNAQIFGLDDGSGLGWFECNEDRIQAFKINATDPKAVNQVLGDQTFDFICDDASHIMQEQLATREILWPRLNPGGLYVCEDLQTQEAVDKLKAIGGGTVYVGRTDIPAAVMIAQEKPL